MFRNVDELRHKIRITGLTIIEEKIIQLAKPSIQMIRTRVNEIDLPIATSKLGGNPDLPKDFQWPYWSDKPLTFIAQFKLSELVSASFEAPDSTFLKQLTLWDMDTIARKNNVSLPLEEGMLYFFYDVDTMPSGQAEECEGWRVFYVQNEAEPFERRNHPTYQGTWGLVQALPEHPIKFLRRISLSMHYPNDAMFLFDNIDDDSMPLSWYEEGYWELVYTNYPKPYHCFYGYPRAIQGSVELYCIQYTRELKQQGIASLNKEDDWQFLFQIDSDLSLNMTWGDMGTLYVCIPKTSLLEHRFEDCWVIRQSH